MLRGRRLPLPQSPLSRWRTTAPAPGLRRATSTTFSFSTTVIRRNDDAHGEPPTTKSEREQGKPKKRAKSRLRIHKIGANGDEWAFFQARRSANPATRHVKMSLQGKNPFGDRNEYERHLAVMNARRQGRSAPKRHDPPQEAKQAKDYYYRKLQLRGNKSQKARQKATRTLPSVGKDTLRDEQLSHKAPGSTNARAYVFAEGLQGIITRGPGLPASDGHEMQMPPRAQKAITRQYELVAFDRKPLFNSRLSNAQDASSLQAPHRAEPIDAGQYSGELPVAAADIGPAESFQRSFTDDPVLMKAKSLAGSPLFSVRSSPRLEMTSVPRFRLVRTWRSTPGKIPRSPQLSEDKPKSLESHMSELQIENETNWQPGQVSDSRPSRPETTGPEWGETTNDVELKAAQDRLPADTQDAPTVEDEVSGAGDHGERVAEPAQSPATDDRTIFEKLFAQEKRTKGTEYWQLSSKLRSMLAAERGEPIGETEKNILETAQQDGPNPPDGLSIFRQLFPEQAEPEMAQSESGPDTSRTVHEILQAPEDEVFVSLRNEVRNWVSEEGEAQASWPKAGDYGSHSTVVVISGTSPSLMDTDFYRIAPEGKHVEGWAGGLVKVVQAHDSISYEPLGQYYLMFHSRPSALAYVDEVRRLHELSRRLLHAPGDSGAHVAKGALDQARASPQPFLTDEERAAVRSFTLCPPHVTPRISVRMWNTELVKELAAKSNIADVLPTLRPEGSTPARVLLRLTSPDGQHGEGQGGLTADELWLTLRDDGRERSAPWVLANLSEGIMPVKPRFVSEHYKITVRAEPVPVALEPGDDDGEDGEGSGQVAGPPPAPPRGDANGDAAVDRNERFRRFVLTFAQPAIARRFVRCWHKRVVYDALLDRSVVIDAVAIM